MSATAAGTPGASSLPIAIRTPRSKNTWTISACPLRTASARGDKFDEAQLAFSGPGPMSTGTPWSKAATSAATLTLLVRTIPFIASNLACMCSPAGARSGKAPPTHRTSRTLIVRGVVRAVGRSCSTKASGASGTRGPISMLDDAPCLRRNFTTSGCPVRIASARAVQPVVWSGLWFLKGSSARLSRSTLGCVFRYFFTAARSPVAAALNHLTLAGSVDVPRFSFLPLPFLLDMAEALRARERERERRATRWEELQERSSRLFHFPK